MKRHVGNMYVGGVEGLCFGKQGYYATGCRKKSNCVGVYEKITLLMT